MEDYKSLSQAKIVLEAVHLSSNADIQSLHQLIDQRPDVLKLELILRMLLTFLPEGTEPGTYNDLLYSLSQNKAASYNPSLYDATTGHSSAPSLLDMPEAEARLRLKRLRLKSLTESGAYYDQDADLLTLFLLRQAHEIDAQTGSLNLVRQLLEPFISHSEKLREWAITYLLPLLRLEYQYYVHSDSSLSLVEFEKLDEKLAIQFVLSRGSQSKDPGDTQDIGRDLRGLLGPRMYGESSRKRRRLNRKSHSRQSSATEPDGHEVVGEHRFSSGWSCVNDWILELSARDFQKSVDVVQNWMGPGDVDYGEWGNDVQKMDEGLLRSETHAYAQAGLAAVYATNTCSMETIIGSHRILMNVAHLVDEDEPPDLKRTGDAITSGISRDFLDNLSPTHLFHNALLRPGNPFTTPSPSSIMLFNIFLYSCYKLHYFGNKRSCRGWAELSLFATEDEQGAELRKTLYTLKSDSSTKESWPSIRRQMLWLRHWELHQGTEDEPRGVFGRIARVKFETELLRAMLDGGAYSVAEDVYCRVAEWPLPKADLEDTVLNAALSSYDASGSCSSRDSSLKASYGMVERFSKYFSDSRRFAQIQALHSATQAISTYNLTLQQGILLRPVNIRVSKDPTSLISKILSQSQGSYAHLDPYLLGIGNDLVRAGISYQNPEYTLSPAAKASVEDETITTRRMITKMAIEAALKADDFDTAYSMITTGHLSSDVSRPQDAVGWKVSIPQDDISWRAVLGAGRDPITPSTQLRNVEQHLELLSQALILAPPSALADILASWQQCELELNSRIAREAQAEAKWDEKGDRKVPGGFDVESTSIVYQGRNPSRNALAEDAPMGLFDVARGAAAALSKNAFPLRKGQMGEGSTDKVFKGRPLSTASIGSSDEGDINGAGGQGRVRKRDMVSSMVTGGLASGIGWVIGESGKVRQGLYT